MSCLSTFVFVDCPEASNIVCDTPKVDPVDPFFDLKFAEAYESQNCQVQGFVLPSRIVSERGLNC